MDHQGAPNVNFHHYALKKSELAKNCPSSGPRLSQISTNIKCQNLAVVEPNLEKVCDHGYLRFVCWS